MKAIINGKTYNTETAEEVAQGDNDCNLGDGYRRTEELYLTKKGTYFILTAQEQIVVVNENGKLLRDPSRFETCTIFEWLENWDIRSLKEREMKYFKIEEG